ncbi:6889_t:CDS:2, partial [Scutellospora calospora]
YRKYTAKGNKTEEEKSSRESASRVISKVLEEEDKIFGVSSVRAKEIKRVRYSKTSSYRGEKTRCLIGDKSGLSCTKDHVIEINLERCELVRILDKRNWKSSKRVKIYRLLVDTEKGLVEIPEDKLLKKDSKFIIGLFTSTKLVRKDKLCILTFWANILSLNTQLGVQSSAVINSSGIDISTLVTNVFRGTE